MCIWRILNLIFDKTPENSECYRDHHKIVCFSKGIFRFTFSGESAQKISGGGRGEGGVAVATVSHQKGKWREICRAEGETRFRQQQHRFVQQKYVERPFQRQPQLFTT